MIITSVGSTKPINLLKNNSIQDKTSLTFKGTGESDELVADFNAKIDQQARQIVDNLPKDPSLWKQPLTNKLAYAFSSNCDTKVKEYSADSELGKVKLTLANIHDFYAHPTATIEVTKKGRTTLKFSTSDIFHPVHSLACGVMGYICLGSDGGGPAA